MHCRRRLFSLSLPPSLPPSPKPTCPVPSFPPLLFIALGGKERRRRRRRKDRQSSQLGPIGTRKEKGSTDDCSSSSSYCFWDRGKSKLLSPFFSFFTVPLSLRMVFLLRGKETWKGCRLSIGLGFCNPIAWAAAEEQKSEY